MRFVEPSMWLGEHMPLIEEQTDDGLALLVDVEGSRAGDARGIFTRVRANALLAQDCRFRLEAKSADLPEHLATLATLDTEFDEDYALTAESDGDAKTAAKMVNDEVRGALVAMRGRRGVRLDYTRGDITLTWRGAETDAAQLDHARAVVLTLARYRAAPVGYR